MSERIRLDIRAPLGALFAVIGLLLAAFGAIAGAPGAWINVDLWWGLVMLLFGAGALVLALRARRRSPTTDESGIH